MDLMPSVSIMARVAQAGTRQSQVEPASDHDPRRWSACRERSTGDNQRLGKISKAGNERLQQFLCIFATFATRPVKLGSQSASVRL